MDTLEFLQYEDIAEETGIPASTLRVMAQRGKLPEPTIRVGQSPGWGRATIQKWIEANKRA